MAYEDDVPPVWVDLLWVGAACVGAACLFALFLYLLGLRADDVIPHPRESPAALEVRAW